MELREEAKVACLGHLRSLRVIYSERRVQFPRAWSPDRLQSSVEPCLVGSQLFFASINCNESSHAVHERSLKVSRADGESCE